MFKAANRTPSTRGGGDVGKMVRSMQQAGRAIDRSSQANAVKPYEAQKQQLDNQMAALNGIINQLDGYIIAMQTNDPI